MVEVSLGVSIFSAAVAVVAILVAARAIHETKRGADAAERGATAAEEENRMLRDQLAGAAAENAPLVTVEVKQVSVRTHGRDGLLLNLLFSIENRSRIDEVLRRLGIEFDGCRYGLPPEPSEIPLQKPGNFPGLPLELAHGVPTDLRLIIPAHRLVEPTERVPAKLNVECTRAGRAVADFTIFMD